MSVQEQREQEQFRILAELSRLQELDLKVALERRAWEIRGRDIEHAAGMIKGARARLLVQLATLLDESSAGEVEAGAEVAVLGRGTQLLLAGGVVH